MHRLRRVGLYTPTMVATVCAVSSIASIATAQATATALAPAVRSLRLERVNESNEKLVFTNTASHAVRLWQVSVYDCNLYVRSGCGTTDPHLEVQPHDSVTLRTFAIMQGWRLYYEVSWRSAPPANAVHDEFTVRASGPGALLVAPRALAAESFRPLGKSHSLGLWQMINPAQRISVWLEQLSNEAGDSLRIELSGARMNGDSGRVFGDEDQWRPLTTDDTADISALRSIANDLRQAEAAASDAPLDTAEAMHDAALALPSRAGLPLAPRRLGNGEWEICRYAADLTATPLVVRLERRSGWCEPERSDSEPLKYNAFVIVDPTSYPVGKLLETCAAYTTNLPGQWDRVEWHRDPKRCPADGRAADSTQPNVLVLKRRD